MDGALARAAVMLYGSGMDCAVDEDAMLDGVLKIVCCYTV